MRSRNKLWSKQPFVSNDIRILNPDGSLKEIIQAQNAHLYKQKQHRVVIEESPDILEERRDTPEYKAWRDSIKARDKETCALCGSKEWIQVHHIERWIDDKKSRYENNNGICLCIPCHCKYHGPQNKPFPKEVTTQLYHCIRLQYEEV